MKRSRRAGPQHRPQAGFHFTPKHGSWLNIAEIELAVLANMCPDRIPDEATLRKHVEANVKERNAKSSAR